MNVLVTGSTGFIGRAICNRLASSNDVIFTPGQVKKFDIFQKPVYKFERNDT